MDYKSIISDCQLRSEEFRMMHNAEGVVHELQCAKAIEDLQAKCKRLDEARERANEAADKWESMYHVALERAEREEIARKQGKVMVCPVCQGRGRVHTSFYGYGNCTMEDVKNDKFPPVCRTCKGRGIIEVNEF